MQFCSSKNKNAKYKNAAALCEFSNAITHLIKRGDSAAHHYAALQPSRIGKQVTQTIKQHLEARFGPAWLLLQKCSILPSISLGTSSFPRAARSETNSILHSISLGNLSFPRAARSEKVRVGGGNAM